MENIKQKLKYGIRDEELVHISTVDNGLNCNCTCPNCGGKLIARKGKINEHHFAHYDSADCNQGSETALHLMAKQIINETKRVYVPYVPHDEYDFKKRGGVFSFEQAEIERQLGTDLRSDVLLTIDKKILNVEIKVNHAVDENKLIKLFNNEIPTIEIDLSEFVEDFSIEKITRIILNGSKTKLLYSPKAKGIFAKQLLGEWKKIKGNKKKYVEKCHYTKEKAYFAHVGGKNECHECYGGREFGRSNQFLCRAMYGELNFNEIEKIIEISRQEGIVEYAKVLMRDKSVKEFKRAGQ